jgi:hypothetical protein
MTCPTLTDTSNKLRGGLHGGAWKAEVRWASNPGWGGASPATSKNIHGPHPKFSSPVAPSPHPYPPLPATRHRCRHTDVCHLVPFLGGGERGGHTAGGLSARHGLSTTPPPPPFHPPLTPSHPHNLTPQREPPGCGRPPPCLVPAALGEGPRRACWALDTWIHLRMGCVWCLWRRGDAGGALRVVQPLPGVAGMGRWAYPPPHLAPPPAQLALLPAPRDQLHSMLLCGRDCASPACVRSLPASRCARCVRECVCGPWTVCLPGAPAGPLGPPAMALLQQLEKEMECSIW